MNHDFEAMLASIAKEAASEAIRQVRIEEQGRQQDPAGERLLLRSNEAAEQLAISPATLQRLTKSGELPCVRIGSSVRYSSETLLDWIRQKELSSDGDQPVHPPKRMSRSVDLNTAFSQTENSRKPVRDQADPKRSRSPEKKRPAGRKKTPTNRTNESEERRIVSPLDDLLDELGVERNDLPPVTNGDLKRIAESDTVTIHGWLHSGRGLPEAETQRLKRHFIQYRKTDI